MGFTVLGALHYDAAIEHLAVTELHLACIDLELPTASGFEVCEHIRGTLGLVDVPILVTSESGDPEHMAYAERGGRECVSAQSPSRCETSFTTSRLSFKSAGGANRNCGVYGHDPDAPSSLSALVSALVATTNGCTTTAFVWINDVPTEQTECGLLSSLPATC